MGIAGIVKSRDFDIRSQIESKFFSLSKDQIGTAAP